MAKEGTNRTFGAKCWIRLRGSPNDPESFELAAWTGIAWEIPAKTNDGRIVVLSIPDYMVAETLPAETDPEKLYHPLKVA